MDLATFIAGPMVYVVEVPWTATSRLEVAVRHDGQVHRDRFDLAAEAQRQRFASSAAVRCGINASLVEKQLVALLDAVRGLQSLDDPAAVPAFSITDTDRDAATALLRAPDLLDRLTADLDRLGWVGEDDAKRLLYLIAVSRKLPEPTWAVLQTPPGGGRNQGFDLLTALSPAEDVVQVSRLTDAALYHQDAEALRHKLLILDDASALSAEVITALQVLHTRGALSIAQVSRPGTAGSSIAPVVEARGPVAVLSCATGKINDHLASRCCIIPTDDSPEQTARILAAQRRLRAEPSRLGDAGERSSILRQHHNAQRLLACRPVVIPYAERIEFPAVAVRHRRDQDLFFGLIEASALLHQFQRLNDRDHIVADERDFHLALRLARTAGIGADQGLGRQAGQLLAALWAGKHTTFTMDLLATLFPHWTRYAFRAALRELSVLEYVASPHGGRGSLREYRLVASGQAEPATTTGIRLLPAGQVGGLATVGEIGKANFTFVTATG